MKSIPTIGIKYDFYDDGIRLESHHFVAEVMDIITPNQAKDIVINDESLYTIWRREIDDHRQSTNFIVHNGSDTNPGSPWLYAENTDYFIKCRIPEYVDYNVWFVRDVKGGWHSLNTESYLMGGRLVVSDDLTELNLIYSNSEIIFRDI